MQKQSGSALGYYLDTKGRKAVCGNTCTLQCNRQRETCLPHLNGQFIDYEGEAKVGLLAWLDDSGSGEER